jgi:hypothetical protein
VRKTSNITKGSGKAAVRILLPCSKVKQQHSTRIIPPSRSWPTGNGQCEDVMEAHMETCQYEPVVDLELKLRTKCHPHTS